MHLVDWQAGFAGSTSIVGGTIPVGGGLAFASHLRRETHVTAIGIGDAALEEGVFHESANFASLHKLPVLFVSENNLYSCYTHIKDRQPNRPLTDIARGHGMRYLTLDGNDVFAIASELKPLMASLRRGEGPVFLELQTYRHLEHCGPNNDDHLNYRPSAELQSWRDQDPLLVTRKQLEGKGLWSAQWHKEMEDKVFTEVQEAFTHAVNAPFPETSELGAYIYASH